MNAKIVVGLGELLWDFLPGGRQLGGAPANFAHCIRLLGDQGIIASRIADDDLGREAHSSLLQRGASCEYLQRDADHPTGTVKVRVDKRGQPHFEIAEPVAWDFLEWTDDWQNLAGCADAVCFGSLAQRSAQSRQATATFLKAMRTDAVRIFDVNLRQPFYSAEVISQSLALADIVKLNRDELPIVANLLGLRSRQDEQSLARDFLDSYQLDVICVTRGDAGSLLLRRDESDDHAGFRVRVLDTVGAGDAFTAGLVHAYLRQFSLPEMNDLANRMGAWVSSNSGGTPVPQGNLRNILEALGQLE